jgi:hypothetical protein
MSDSRSKYVGSVTMTRRNKSNRYTQSPVSVVRGFLHYPFDDPPTSFERRQAEPAGGLARGLFQAASQATRREGFGRQLKISG